MAGDPCPGVTVDLMHKLVEHGADIIEVGLPFSDPMADGPIIAHAAERALAVGVSTRDALNMIAKFRQTNQTTPVLVMGYLNPVEIIGYDNFANLCADAGVDAILMVDLPPNEADGYAKSLTERTDHPMNQIFCWHQPQNQIAVPRLSKTVVGLFIMYHSKVSQVQARLMSQPCVSR